MKTAEIEIEKLIPYAKNARNHSDLQVAQIAASIKEMSSTLTAPAATAEIADASDRFQTWTLTPAFARLIAIGRPIAPRPITATL